jgi:hypothetical protein
MLSVHYFIMPMILNLLIPILKSTKMMSKKEACEKKQSVRPNITSLSVKRIWLNCAHFLQA